LGLIIRPRKLANEALLLGSRQLCSGLDVFWTSVALLLVVWHISARANTLSSCDIVIPAKAFLIQRRRALRVRIPGIWAPHWCRASTATRTRMRTAWRWHRSLIESRRSARLGGFQFAILKHGMQFTLVQKLCLPPHAFNHGSTGLFHLFLNKASSKRHLARHVDIFSQV
jgi:hypothetical protein